MFIKEKEISIQQLRRHVVVYNIIPIQINIKERNSTHSTNFNFLILISL